jgi:hypothetical protein
VDNQSGQALPLPVLMLADLLLLPLIPLQSHSMLSATAVADLSAAKCQVWAHG